MIVNVQSSIKINDNDNENSSISIREFTSFIRAQRHRSENARLSRS